jgi:hypothetical protein
MRRVPWWAWLAIAFIGYQMLKKRSSSTSAATYTGANNPMGSGSVDGVSPEWGSGGVDDQGPPSLGNY